MKVCGENGCRLADRGYTSSQLRGLGGRRCVAAAECDRLDRAEAERCQAKTLRRPSTLNGMHKMIPPLFWAWGTRSSPSPSTISHREHGLSVPTPSCPGPRLSQRPPPRIEPAGTSGMGRLCPARRRPHRQNEDVVRVQGSGETWRNCIQKPESFSLRGERDRWDPKRELHCGLPYVLSSSCADGRPFRGVGARRSFWRLFIRCWPLVSHSLCSRHHRLCTN